MEDYAKILWEGYGLRLYSGSRTRTGFVCKTDRGMREVKKAQYRRQNVLFAHEAKEHLYRNGFRCINRYHLSTEGEPYYLLDGIPYMLEDVLTAQPLDDSRPDTYPIGAQTLAKLHEAGKGMSGSVSMMPPSSQADFYSRRRRELLRIKKRIDRQSSFSAVDLLVAQNFNAYLHRVETAEAILSAASYEKEVERATQERSLCHNSFKGDNIRRDPQGQIWVTGFGKCAYGSRLQELAAYFRQFIKKTNANLQTAEAMIAAYHAESPLSREDIRIVLGHLTYPEKFMRLCNEYYNKRRVCISPAVKERLLSCVAESPKQSDFLQAMEKLT